MRLDLTACAACAVGYFLSLLRSWGLRSGAGGRDGECAASVQRLTAVGEVPGVDGLVWRSAVGGGGGLAVGDGVEGEGEGAEDVDGEAGEEAEEGVGDVAGGGEGDEAGED